MKILLIGGSGFIGKEIVRQSLRAGHEVALFNRGITSTCSDLPGVRAVAANGHTPGHTVYVIESNGQKLVLWGDLMHVAAVQFPEPAVTIAFDTDSAAAAAQRAKAYADAAQGRFLVAAAHLPFPGIGHLRSEGKGYAWIPITYTTAR